jgi:hypothetical protein
MDYKHKLKKDGKTVLRIDKTFRNKDKGSQALFGAEKSAPNKPKKVKKVLARKPRKKKVIVYPVNYHLHTKKLGIMRAIPIMPCTVITKTRQGFIFAHTQATEVYNTYRRECESRGLVIRRVEGKTTSATHPELDRKNDQWIVVEKPCVRFEGIWEIVDVESGERETFGGAGDGSNNIWSANSSQTIAKKQALLDYFEVAWPQPTDWVRTVKESIEELGPEQMFKALQEIIPAKIFEATKIGDILGDYFNKAFQKGKRK